MYRNPKYPFSDELSGDDPNKKINIKDAIGKTIFCDDGIPRRVVDIAFSMRWPWRVIINENDPESKMGYFCNKLSFTCQLLGKPLPTEDEIKAFEKTVRVRFKVSESGWYDAAPGAKMMTDIWLPPHVKN